MQCGLQCTLTTNLHSAIASRIASQIADSACPFFYIGKKGMPSQHFVMCVVPPLASMVMAYSEMSSYHA